MNSPKIFHGNITTDEIANSIIAKYNTGNLRAQKLGTGKHIVVQIATRDRPRSGGHTALSVSIRQVEDGISIQLGEQSWLGVAASLGQTFLWAWRNPWSLISRLDDLVQDFEHLQLSDQLWEFIEDNAYAAGLSFELSERLRRLDCKYCHTANPIGEPSCIACGAPLGTEQPDTCMNCGYVIKPEEIVCANCGESLKRK